ncbi:nucleotidyltransferase domain-containing protein [Halarcobacter sp.]|uniref:nucleotidyltransferase family protein n=1 Tax=Halarcobacter sp. TaxID=2321133 RepID=UPI0029F4965C|nr:nucleotidyltransferase domain-containing protein [Halarcobacter sp.]
MRLKKVIVDKIKDAILNSFGDVNIYIFGSRVDDSKRGGDIDIAIDSNFGREEFRKRKIKLISNLLRKDFDLKIDIVNYNTNDEFLKKQIVKNCIKI